MKLITPIALATLLGLTACGKKTPTPPDSGATTPATTLATLPATNSSGIVDAAIVVAAPDASAGETAAQPCPGTLNGQLTTDLTIGSDCGTVHVTSNLSVDGATLTIQAGVTLAFDAGTGLSIGYDKPAKLIVLGGPGKSVTFTSAGDKVPGAWTGIALNDNADRTGVTDLVIEFAGSDDGAAIDAHDVEDVTLRKVTFRQIKGFGLRVAPTAKVALLESTFDQIGGMAAIRAGPESVGGIASTNTVAQTEKAFTFVGGGEVHRDITWHNLGMPLVLLDRVTVQGNEGGSATLTIEPGAVIQLEKNVILAAGYVQRGTIRVAASRESPVVFTAHTGDDAGSWVGIHIENQGTAELDGVVFEKGGGENAGVLAVLAISGDGTLTLANAVFRKNTCGLQANGEAHVKAVRASSFDGGCAMRLGPKGLGALHPDNTYAPKAYIEVVGGDITTDTTWQPQAAQIAVIGNVTVSKNATLTLAAGLALSFATGIALEAGYVDPATIKLAGTAEKHIVLTGERDEVGTWAGIFFFTNARSNEAHFVDIRNADEPAALHIDDPADLVADHITCAKCKAAAITWGCKAKVTATDIVATEGTPATEKKPEGCP